jgi:hypothetical protein
MMTTTETGAGPARPGLAWAAPASIGAGVVHASAVGAHGEHRATALTFALLAVLQVGWGVLVLRHPGRRWLWAGVAGNGLAVLGWLAAKTTGIGLVDGLESAEAPGVPDTVAALMAGAAVAGGLVALLASDRPRRPVGAARVPASLGAAVLVVVAMVATGDHTGGSAGHGHGQGELAAASHEDDHDDDHHDSEDHDDHDDGDAHGAGHGTGSAHGDPADPDDHDDHSDHTATTTGRRAARSGDPHDHGPGTTDPPHDHDPGTTDPPHDHDPGPGPGTTDPPHDHGPKPYDGTLPVDLGGVPGVSAEQQAWAEALVTATILALDHFATTDAAYAAGYRSIGDAATGYEHWINWPMLEDGRTFDASAPESLVYRVSGGQRTLEAAMYLLEPGATLDNAPDLGGPLVQYHIHNDLCWYGEENNWQVALADPLPAPCPPGYHRRAVVPMVHVWIVGNPCGPFAALEGVGGGQVRPGEPVNCDDAHGTH